jgi:hypothetical protein
MILCALRKRPNSNNKQESKMTEVYHYTKIRNPKNHYLVFSYDLNASESTQWIATCFADKTLLQANQYQAIYKKLSQFGEVVWHDNQADIIITFQPFPLRKEEFIKQLELAKEREAYFRMECTHQNFRYHANESLHSISSSSSSSSSSQLPLSPQFPPSRFTLFEPETRIHNSISSAHQAAEVFDMALALVISREKDNFEEDFELDLAIKLQTGEITQEQVSEILEARTWQQMQPTNSTNSSNQVIIHRHPVLQRSAPSPLSLDAGSSPSPELELKPLNGRDGRTSQLSQASALSVLGFHGSSSSSSSNNSSSSSSWSNNYGS